MPTPMQVADALLVVLKNVVYRLVCLGNATRYFTLKARVMVAASQLGLYEAAFMKLLPLFIRPGSEAVDVGANAGAYTLRMAQLTASGGQVFAFEPLPPVADILAETCRRLTNVVVAREALSSGEDASVELHVPLLAGGVPEPSLAAVDASALAGRGLRTWKVFRVPVRRLDDHLAGFRDVSFIKVDVEGHEAAFLSGAAETIRRFRPVLQLEASGLRAHDATVERWARATGYVLLNLRDGRLEVAATTALAGLNVYGFPQERLASLPAGLLRAARPV
jgi:FkbM family methyltransferase